MQIHVQEIHSTNYAGDCLVIPVFADAEPSAGAFNAMDRALAGALTKLLQDTPNSTDFGAITPVYTMASLAAHRLILVGAGKETELTIDKVRALSGIGTRAAAALMAKSVGFAPCGELFFSAAGYQAIAEGAVLGTYQFHYYKSDKSKNYVLQEVVITDIAAKDAAIAKKAVAEGQAIAESVNLARDMVNHPSQHVTPGRMVEYAQKIAETGSIKLTILDSEQMAAKKMGALLAVAKGSDEPAKLIALQYHGDPASQEVLAFVGKGITFDSGGISLKPSEGMGDMKDDMAGAAAVLGAMAAVSRLKPKANILGVVPCTENMPSGHAFKPGDVITAMSGRTIEVITTDAEGRLVLADAIAYAKELGATRIIDLATLTGACVVALGTVASGVMTNNDPWCKTVLDASCTTGEKMWQLPMFDEYKEQIKSPIADIKNSGGRPAGTITAGLFLREFAGETPWVHIDIAGTVSSDKDAGYQVKGATGVGVRTLTEIALRMGRS